MHLFIGHYIIYNALGVVAQLVRASACHAEGRGFEPRQSRQYSHRSFERCFFLFFSGREPAGSERQLTRTNKVPFESYVVKGAHRGNVPQMGIYNPVNPASIHTVPLNGVFSCLLLFFFGL